MTSYIYFIQAHGDGPIKIGTTQYNPLRRMVKIQSDCPWPVKLLGTIVGSVSAEKKIHLVLAPWRTQGEWFSPNAVVLAAISEALRCGIVPPFRNQRKGAKHRHPICEYRHIHGMTLRDLATKTGLTYPTLSRFERGINKPNVASVQALSRVTGLTAMDLRPDFFGEITQ